MLLTNVSVVLITWDVPYGEVVREVRTYAAANEADILSFINDEAKKWWDSHEGARWVEEAVAHHNHVIGGQIGHRVVKPWVDILDQIGLNKVRVYDVEEAPQPFTPIKELGYDTAEWHLWCGENGFKAVLDHATYATLHNAHYKREYDDKGISRPGYLLVAEAFGDKPE